MGRDGVDGAQDVGEGTDHELHEAGLFEAGNASFNLLLGESGSLGRVGRVEDPKGVGCS